MTLFLIAAVMPSTVVMFAILAGFFYLAWSAGWIVGLTFTVLMIGMVLVMGRLTLQRVKKIRDAQANNLT